MRPHLGMFWFARWVGVGSLVLFCLLSGWLAGCVAEPTGLKSAGAEAVGGSVLQYYSRPNDDPWETRANCQALDNSGGLHGDCRPYETAIIGVHGELQGQILRVTYGAMLWTLDVGVEEGAGQFFVRQMLEDGSAGVEAALMLADKKLRRQSDWPFDFLSVDESTKSQSVAFAALELGGVGSEASGVLQVWNPRGRAGRDGQVVEGPEIQQEIHWHVSGGILVGLELRGLRQDGYYDAVFESEKQLLEGYLSNGTLGAEQQQWAQRNLSYLNAVGVGAVKEFSPTVCVAGACEQGAIGERYLRRVLNARQMESAIFEVRDLAIRQWATEQ